MGYKLNKSDIYMLVLFYVIGIAVTLSTYDFSTQIVEALLDTLIYVTFSFTVVYIIVFIFFPYFFPKNKIFLLFLCTAVLMAIAGVLEIYFYNLTEGEGAKFLEKYLFTFKVWLWGIATSAQNAGILLGVFLGKKFYDAQLEVQAKEKEKRESELRLLKAQIDPHFLFNNLNTVDSLIDSDPTVAKAYLQKLSQLYRYLISTKDDEIVPLEDEINFAKNYMFLIEKRFGSAYQFSVEGMEGKEEVWIPPGALQTLIENVVKHNIGQAEDPIYTDIIVHEDKVIVTNDLRLKQKTAESTKTGFKNLQARFALLTDQPVEIIVDDKYTVVLPLIKEVD